MRTFLFFFFVEGGCLNASPAGKRRIAIGADQQFNDEFFNGRMSSGETNALFARFGSSFSAIVAVAVAACVLIVTLFGVIFAVLQVNSITKIWGFMGRFF